MAHKLAVLDGLRAGTEIELPDGDLTIGRDGSNDLAFDDRLVSRRHALIALREGRRVLCDLESHNGTFVNGLPVGERVLAHGDRISIGASTLVFLERDEEPTSATGQLDADDATGTATAVRLRLDDTLYLQSERLLAPPPHAPGLVRGFRALLDISIAIASLRDVEALAYRLLELLFEPIPAEEGAIVLVGRRADDVVARYGWKRHLGRCTSAHVSRTIVRHVVEGGEAVLTNDLLSDGPFGEAESVRAYGGGSILAVPLVRDGTPLGVVYLSTSGTRVRFDEDHLQLLAAASRVAAPVFESARHAEMLERENRLLADEIALEHEMVGESAPMRAVFDLVARVAARDSTVLVLGESGTGKELVARAIHRASPRARKPFVAVNCATLTENLLESELFGHERGAFTGAVGLRRGKFELADGGTIFLDEIGELAPVLQAKLLRVLQEREVERIGGSRTIPVDVRVIAATNRDLRAAVAAGQYRRDLYYRLDVVSVRVPPLRERREDVPLLAAYFAAKFGEKCKRRVLGVSREARTRLAAYDWPGNVRELENAIERAVVLGTADRIIPEDLPETVRRAGVRDAEGEPANAAGCADDPTDFHRAIAEFRRKLVRDALERSGGNVTEAARLLGVHRNYVARLAKSTPDADGDSDSNDAR